MHNVYANGYIYIDIYCKFNYTFIDTHEYMYIYEKITRKFLSQQHLFLFHFISLYHILVYILGLLVIFIYLLFYSSTSVFLFSIFFFICVYLYSAPSCDKFQNAKQVSCNNQTVCVTVTKSHGLYMSLSVQCHSVTPSHSPHGILL